MMFLHSKRREKMIFYYVYMSIVLIYIGVLNLIPGYDQSFKYALVFSPLIFILMIAFVYVDRANNYDEGIKGEDKVEKILDELGIYYQRNVQDKSKKFDYDFHAIYKGKHYLLEVKNYDKVNSGSLQSAISQAKKNAASLSEIISGEQKREWVEPLAVFIENNAFTQNYENVVNLKDLKQFFLNIK